MSKMIFLGTGAADWDINCRNGFFRRNSAALINGNLMLDCGAHIFDFAECEHNPELYDNVADILITHSHSDHVCRESIIKIAQKQKIRVGCSEKVRNLIGEAENIEYTAFEPFKEYSVGEYKVIPLLANHHIVIDATDAAYHYIVTTPDGKTVFYGLDGAWFLRPSWEVMKQYKFDVMVLDCTVGDMEDWRIFEHNTIPMLRMMIKEIQNVNMLNENGKVIASHMARTLHSSHVETAGILKELGLETAYDGMITDF